MEDGSCSISGAGDMHVLLCGCNDCGRRNRFYVPVSFGLTYCNDGFLGIYAQTPPAAAGTIGEVFHGTVSAIPADPSSLLCDMDFAV